MTNKHDSNYKDGAFRTIPNKKLEVFTKYPISLVLIICISFLIRLHHFPYNIPLTLDALNDYFFSATDLSILGHLTASLGSAHIGWPIFLSFFFTIFRFDNFLDYMTLQREITIGLSILTIIPVYFLCKRFIDKPYAMVGSAIFAFDPRIIQNSLLGITEPLYILLLASAFALYFSSERKLVYISFALVGLSAIVRGEGLFVFLPMILMFYVRNRKEAKIVFKVILCVTIFILLLLPIALFRISTHGSDGFTDRIAVGTNDVLVTSHNVGISGVLKHATENFLKLGGWSLVPIFMILLPIGLYFFIKEKNIDKITILVIIIFMLIPVFYVLSVGSDTRYLYPLFPLFSVIASFTIKKAVEKKTYKTKFLVLIISAILITSVVFLEIKKFDYEHQRESFVVAQKVVSIAKGINDYYPEESYVEPAELPKDWPQLKSSVNYHVHVISTQGYDSLEKYIKSSRDKGLTHLILDGNKNRPSFLNDAYYHDEKYPYLIKVYDASDNNLKYHAKIYKIDYDKFEQFNHS